MNSTHTCTVQQNVFRSNVTCMYIFMTVKCISKVQIWVLHYIVTKQIKQQLCSDLQPDHYYTCTRNLSTKIALKWKT